jgi:hypothetical protein
VVDGTVFVRSDDTNLYAVDAATGEQEWVFETGGVVQSSPTVVDETVFVGSADNSLYAVDAATGEQEWVFETWGRVESSPTVANGVVFVGSYNEDLYAVDAETGEEQWQFDTGESVVSSPMVVDGTVFVGGGSNLYAVDATNLIGTSSSQDSASQDRSTAETATEFTEGAVDAAGSFFSNPLYQAAVGIAVGPVFGYGLYRSITDRDNQRDSSDSSIGATTADSTDSSGSSSHNTTTIDDHQAAAETAIETAATTKSNNNLGDAAEAYSEAITEYQAAVEALAAGASEQQKEIEQAIESARADLEAVKTQREQQSEVIEALQPAERSLQEAIVAYIANDQTVARIRFRQARDAFGDAHETIVESEVDLLTVPVAVDVQPDRKPPSTTIGDLPRIPAAAATELADVGIETIDDLDRGEESPWTPAAVQELLDKETIEEDVATTLTLLSWWDGDESYEFDTTEAVETRHQQADYGFNHTS